MGRGGLPEPGGNVPGMAGLGAAFAACRARALRFPPSLELLRSFPRTLGLDSPSSAEKVDISSVDCVAAGIEWISSSSLRPMKPPNIVRVWRRLGFTGGIGGALISLPLVREDPGGRLTVVILEVDEMNMGSEMSDLLIDFLRIEGAPGSEPPCPVGVLVPEPAGDGCTNAGVGLTTNGAVGEGLGAAPISIPSLPIWRFGNFSKYPAGVDLLLLRDRLEPIIGDGIGDGDAGRPIPGGPGDLGMRRVGRSSYPRLVLDVPSAMAFARSSL